MALTSILQDFEVRQGLIVLGTATVTSSTGMTATLQAYGGAAIAKNLIVGSTSDFSGDGFFRQNLNVTGATFLTGVTSTQIVTISDNTQANTSGNGALKVTGGGYFGNNIVVNGIAASTASATANALYVAGGAGIGGSLYVQGEAVFQNDVIFAGQTTYVYSTNTVYTDNILELHYHENSTTWTVNDGQDIGIRFHYYDTTNTNAFLGRDNSTGYLEWFGRDVSEETTGTVEVGTYGTFRTGSIKLVDTTASNNTSTGALVVEGGVGVKGQVTAGTLSAFNLTKNRIVIVGDNGRLIDDADFYFNTVTNILNATVSTAQSADNLSGGSLGALPYQSSTGTTAYLPIGTAGLVLVSDGGAPTWQSVSGSSVGSAQTATNLAFGAQYQIPYQVTTGATAFTDNLQYDYNAFTFRTINGSFTGTTNSTSTISGALVVAGGIGVGGNITAGGSVSVVNNYAELSLGSTESVNPPTTSKLVFGRSQLGDATYFDYNNATNEFILALNSTGQNFDIYSVSSAGAGTRLRVDGARGDVQIFNTTQSTSTTSGALTVSGGVGIAKNIWVGGNIQRTAGGYPNGVFHPLEIVGGANEGYVVGTFRSLNSGNQSLVSFQNPAQTGDIINIGSSGTGFVIQTGNLTRLAVDVDGVVTIYATTTATSTATGALQVVGGVGIGGNLWVGGDETILGDLEVRGGDITTDQSAFNLINSNATSVSFAGAATSLTIGATSGLTTIRNKTAVSATDVSTSTNSGALTVVGGVGIGGSTYIGEDLVVTGDIKVNGGDITSDAASFNLLNSGVTTVNFAGSATIVNIGNASGWTEIKSRTTVTDTTNATSAVSGALQVRGGVGISGNLWVNQTLRVIQETNMASLRAGVTTATYLTVDNDLSVSGITSLLNNQNSNATTNGALRVTGGVGIGRDVTVGGAITAGVTAAATTATVVPALYSNNMLLATYTSAEVAGVTEFNLDTFSSLVYRSARYFCQIVDGTDVHISEISLFHDGTEAYINEYGIATNNGQLGTFDAELSGNTVIVKFTPFNATAMRVKLVRIGVTA